MKKAERINTMMRYINNRSHFTISEIMEEFNISRSTAIRDIKEIEAMGFPLVAEVGRGGGYSVLNNAMLPAVHFTDDEIRALFIALLASKNQQLPFLKSRMTLSEKIIGLLTIYQQDDLILLNDVLRFQGTNPASPDLLDMSDLPSPLFSEFIQLLLDNRYLQLTTKGNIYSTYILHLYQEYGRWLIEAFDLKEKSTFILAISDLESVGSGEMKPLLSEKEIDNILNKEVADYNIILELGPKAITQYKKYHPFKVNIAYTNPFQLTAICKIVVDIDNMEEIETITNWLLFLGKDMTMIKKPKEIKREINKRF